jgi:hypothetical protein
MWPFSAAKPLFFAGSEQNKTSHVVNRPVNCNLFVRVFQIPTPLYQLSYYGFIFPSKIIYGFILLLSFSALHPLESWKVPELKQLAIVYTRLAIVNFVSRC